MPISPHKDKSQSIGRHIDALVFLLKRDEKVARAQTLRLIRKYSEDEPRDELGRWTDGGGGGGGDGGVNDGWPVGGHRAG